MTASGRKQPSPVPGNYRLNEIYLVKQKHRQKAEMFVFEHNDAQRQLNLAAEKLKSYWSFSVSKWELFQEEAYARRERAYMKLVQLIKRNPSKFDWTILANLDSELTARCIYSDVYYMWEAVREIHDFHRDVYGKEECGSE